MRARGAEFVRSSSRNFLHLPDPSIQKGREHEMQFARRENR